MLSSRRSVRVNRGFTLIEMLVVVAIIVLLAGFILPKLDGVMLKQNKGVAAANIGGLNRYIQTYRVIHNQYPNQWDTLVDVGGDLVLPGDPGDGQVGLDPQLVGGPPLASPTKLSVLDLVAGTVSAGTSPIIAADGEDCYRSLARMGITRFYDSATATPTGSPNDIFDTERTVPATWPPTDAFFATLNTTEGDSVAIIRHIYKYPASMTDATVVTTYAAEGSFLVVLGFDRKNDAVGDILVEAPTYSNTADPQQYYNRLLAVFKVSEGGSRADLVATLGADGDQLHEEIADYYEK